MVNINKIKENHLTIFFSLSLCLLMINLSYINWIVVIVSIYYIFFIIRNKNYKNFLQEKWFIYGLYIFIYLLLVSIMSDYQTVSLRKSFHFLVFLIFALSIKSIILKNYSNKVLYSKIIFYIILFIILDTFFQFIFDKNIFGFEKAHGRLTGPFKNEPLPGAIISKFFLLGIFYLYLKFNSHKYFFYIISLTFFIIGSLIILTTERAAFLNFFIINVLFFIFLKKFRKIIFTSFSLILIVGVLSFLFNKSVESKIRYSLQSIGIINITNQNPDMAKNEKYYYVASSVFDNPYGVLFLNSIEVWKKNKLFGSGLRSYRYECEKTNGDLIKQFVENYKHKKCNTHPHNLYFEILAETGIIGLFIFILYFIYLLRLGIINLKYITDHNEKFFMKLMLFNLLIMFLPFKVSGAFFSSIEGGLNWIFIGIFLSCINKNIYNVKKFEN